jgi:pyruvate dehydrogenase E2 component (dihydrolipoamide acetyltransferase)
MQYLTSVDEAQVSEVMVSVGDIVSAEQSILLIESDKARLKRACTSRW